MALENSNRPSEAKPGGLLGRLLGFLHRHNYMVGVIDDPARAEAAAAALRDGGFPAPDVALQSGTELDERVRREGGTDALLMSEQGALCLDYNEATNTRGGAIVSVYTPTPEQVERARRILSDHGAHDLRHFGDWTITEFPEATQSG
jgi:hypothetical protein